MVNNAEDFFRHFGGHFTEEFKRKYPEEFESFFFNLFEEVPVPEQLRLQLLSLIQQERYTKQQVLSYLVNSTEAQILEETSPGLWSRLNKAYFGGKVKRNGHFISVRSLQQHALVLHTEESVAVGNEE